jgi:hypothetical protein
MFITIAGCKNFVKALSSLAAKNLHNIVMLTL